MSMRFAWITFAGLRPLGTYRPRHRRRNPANGWRVPIESLVLFQVEDQTVTAFVIIGRNLVPIEEGWGTASECIGEKEMAVVVNYDASQAHTFCGFVGPITTSLGEGIAGSSSGA